MFFKRDYRHYPATSIEVVATTMISQEMEQESVHKFHGNFSVNGPNRILTKTKLWWALSSSSRMGMKNHRKSSMKWSKILNSSLLDGERSLSMRTLLDQWPEMLSQRFSTLLSKLRTFQKTEWNQWPIS